jgi:hypothetical protein
MAVSEYQAAYAHLRAVICGGAPPASSTTLAGGPGSTNPILRQQSMGGSHLNHTSVSSPSLPALAGLPPSSSFSSYSSGTAGQLPSPMPSPGGPAAGQPGAWGPTASPMQPTHGHSASAVPALGGRPGTAGGGGVPGGFASTGGAGVTGPLGAGAAGGLQHHTLLTHSQSQAGMGGSGRVGGGMEGGSVGGAAAVAAAGPTRPPPTPPRFAQVGSVDTGYEAERRLVFEVHPAKFGVVL